MGDEQRVVATAWQLEELEQRYADFLATFDDADVAGQAAAFTAQVTLVQAWRRFPFLDPGLPAPLLPATWPGPAAAALFHGRHDAWHAAAQAHWAALCADAGARA